MGEEAPPPAKQEEQPKAEEKVEEKKEEKAEEEKKEEAKPESDKAAEEPPPPPPPPPPFVLFVDLHCMGCAKKIERSISKIRGVEGVVIDMALNQVTIKGVVEPLAICDMIEKKIKRRAKVLSPLPAADGEPIPQVVASQVTGLSTVELNVNMHCEACAEQLKRKILKMKGVQSAVTEFATGKVSVTGTMDSDKLVDYVYKRTKKQAKVVPQPPPPPPQEPEKPSEEEAKPPEEVPAAAEEPKPEEKKEPEPPENKESEPPAAIPEPGHIENQVFIINGDQSGGDGMSMQKLMYYYQYQPLYMVERIPPPQLFSDENPNACCIS